jgi:ubiquinone/menaquinone biosynthesis C-methylase UbiE
VVGVDREAAVIDVARETVGAGEHGNITFEVADAYALPSTDGTFDVVHCHQVLHHLGDPVAGLREMARVARPGGLVSLREADFGAFTWYPELPGLASWMDLFQQVARHNGGEPNAGRRLLAWVHAADLTDVTPSASLWLYATPDDRADWGESWAERVTTTELADQAVDLGIATRSDLAAMAATWRTWAADPDGWLLLPHAECLVRV